MDKSGAIPLSYGHPEGAKEGSGWVIPKQDKFLTPIGLSITTPTHSPVCSSSPKGNHSHPTLYA